MLMTIVQVYTIDCYDYCYVKAVLTATSWRRSSQLGLIAILLRQMAETQRSDHANTAQVGVRFS